MAATRFFKISPEYHSGYHTALMNDDGDYLALDILRNSKEVYRDEDKVIVHTLLDDALLADMADITEVEDPLSMEAVVALGISGSYCGANYSETPGIGLFWFHPELECTKIVGVDEDGTDIEVDIVQRHKWAGEV